MKKINFSNRFYWLFYLLARIVFSKRELGLKKNSIIMENLVKFKTVLEKYNILELFILGAAVVFVYIVLRIIGLYL